MPEIKETIDHEIIRKWAEERNGKPATLAGSAKEGEVGILRIDFSEDEDNPKTIPIAWEQFFQKFDEKELMFKYMEKTGKGTLSRFYKFTQR